MKHIAESAKWALEASDLHLSPAGSSYHELRIRSWRLIRHGEVIVRAGLGIRPVAPGLKVLTTHGDL